MSSLTPAQQHARELLRSQVTPSTEDMARRWEPLSPPLQVVLDDWANSGEFGEILAKLHADLESRDLRS
jgi:hypothetical protein